ncbi:heat shock protein Hsp20 [Denitrovibrio acetiphilus DSM 12809]|uniref:Heat shock protein Hsp20 n=1 Tax=Denitrovibrio acetiphilus (strain DSM 12809 / NBRC 114555 / N2460) TaxID=522772 RepID=D4H6X0_DENA2|nr:Hsp20/alpha crystallin family protein [Denitrovibrio acetiphilus]ADD67836.1 heat shock protein Hsp20 [Denitrovibrio acetiphilus DSM 12809]
MSVKKLVPWNWFKNEEEEEKTSTDIVKNRIGSFEHPFHRVQREMDNLFNSLTRDFWTDIPSMHRGFAEILKPTLDLGETQDDYKISVEVPGVEEKDISIELVDNSLVISGEKKNESKTREENYHRVERSYGSFRRVLTLPENADQNSIRAEFKNGVLKVSIPKKQISGSIVKKIAINSH